MTACHHVRAELGGYVLDALEPAEVESVREHLAQCPACAAEHARARRPALAAGARRRAGGEAHGAGRDRGAPARRGGARAPVERPPAAPAPAPSSSRCARACSRPAASPPRCSSRSCSPSRSAAASPRPARGYEVAMKPVGGSGATATATLRSVEERHHACTCRRPTWPATRASSTRSCATAAAPPTSAGTFRANAAGHAYAVLQTALRRGEYDVIRVVRKQRDMHGPRAGPRRPRGAAPDFLTRTTGGENHENRDPRPARRPRARARGLRRQRQQERRLLEQRLELGQRLRRRRRAARR